MLSILYIVAMMLLLFGITIFVHEWGHFIVARRCGLVVESFSIGMGPPLWQKKIGGVVYKIGAFPIGGYVALPQLDPEGMEKVQGDNAVSRGPLPDISPWKKIAVSVAGPLCNILFAIPLAFLVTHAKPVPENTVVGYVATNSVAYAEGLRPNDRIVQVNETPVEDWYSIMSEDLLTKESGTVVLHVVSGLQTNVYSLPSESTLTSLAPAMRPLLAQINAKDPAGKAGLEAGDMVTRIGDQPIQWWHELSDTLQSYNGKPTTITVDRKGQSITLDITPAYSDTLGKVIIGVTPGDPGMLPWTMKGSSIEQIRNDASKIGRLFKAFVSKTERGNAVRSLGGPIAILSLLWFALKLGIFYAIGFVRFININLAVLNLLPIPVLDGGHICFALWEGVTRRKVHPKVAGTLVNIFAVLLISAILFISWRDADRNWNISRVFNLFHKAPAEQPVEPLPATAEPAK